MGKYFGTDGIRGQFGDAHMNPEFAFRVGVALGRFLQSTAGDKAQRIVIGRDTRASGVELTASIARGLVSQGQRVEDIGVTPTPAVAMAILKRDAAMGIVITASHNPAQDNGIKLFNAKGQKLTDAAELEIEALIDTAEFIELTKEHLVSVDSTSAYIDSLAAQMESGALNDWSIVLDTANGATHETSPQVLNKLGATLHLIGDQPDGQNINAGVGSEYPKDLSEAVKKQGATIGIAHDGDGDRFVVSDESGNIVDGDVLLGIYAIHALQNDALENNTLVATIQSNLGLDAAVRKAGGKVDRVGIGDRKVAERMREIGSNIGGENSGHIIFSDHATTGDGLLAAIQLIKVMVEQKKKLSELLDWVSLFPQRTKNLMVADKLPLERLSTLQDAISSIESSFGEDGRVLVRYSGTEAKLRLLVEGKQDFAVSNALEYLESAARADLSVIDG